MSNILGMRPWLPQIGLVLLSVVPVLAGGKRLYEMSGGAALTPANARFLEAPVPAWIHIIAIALYAVLGAFQFAPALRRGPQAWHRLAGKVLIPIGFLVAGSGLWLTAFYRWPPGDGLALYLTRWLVGVFVLAALAFGVWHLMGQRYAAHGRWMLRAYAVSMGAGTQVLTHVPWFLTHGVQVPGEGIRAVMMGAGWLINLLVAEWLIRRAAGGRPKLQEA